MQFQIFRPCSSGIAVIHPGFGSAYRGLRRSSFLYRIFKRIFSILRLRIIFRHRFLNTINYPTSVFRILLQPAIAVAPYIPFLRPNRDCIHYFYIIGIQMQFQILRSCISCIAVIHPGLCPAYLSPGFLSVYQRIYKHSPFIRSLGIIRRNFLFHFIQDHFSFIRIFLQTGITIAPYISVFYPIRSYIFQLFTIRIQVQDQIIRPALRYIAVILPNLCPVYRGKRP